MLRPSLNPSGHRSARKKSLRARVLTSFAQTPELAAASLARFSEKAWRAELSWLDTSGLALYLLDHLSSHQCQGVMPPPILARLQQNLADNRARNAAMLVEACALTQAFQRENILFIHCKGITLSPDSVPDPALRYQLDLDFRVFAEHAPIAARVLDEKGYRLDCVSGRTWEFLAGSAAPALLQDLYKVKPQRSADLHLIASANEFKRAQLRCFAEISFPVMAPAELFVSQASHLFKHLCSSFTRASWLLEYRRHMLAHNSDASFWREVEACVEASPQDALALGVATLLAARIFGDTPPPLLQQLSTASVPARVQLWIRLYGQTSLLTEYPGTKLYLLLLRELERSSQPIEAKNFRYPAATHLKVPVYSASSRGIKQYLLPFTWPRMIASGNADKTLRTEIYRYRRQLSYVLSRLRFHAIEGFRYLIECTRYRWFLIGLLP